MHWLHIFSTEDIQAFLWVSGSSSGVQPIRRLELVFMVCIFNTLLFESHRCPGDCKKLWNDWRVDVRNCVDLALLARTVDNARWKGKYSQPIGLARLCEAYEELTLNKGKITRSNWEALFSPQQQLCECTRVPVFY